MSATSHTPRYEPFDTHHRVVYQDPREEKVDASDYARGLAAYLKDANPQLKIAIVERLEDGELSLVDIHNRLQEFCLNWDLDKDAAAELAHLVGLGGEGKGADAASSSQALAQQLQVAQAYARHTDVLILVEPLATVDEKTQAFIFSQLEKRVKKHPMLAEKSKIFIVSTTDEVNRRIVRDRAAR